MMYKRTPRLQKIRSQESGRAGQSHSRVQVHLPAGGLLGVRGFAGLCDLTADADHLGHPHQLQLWYFNVHHLKFTNIKIMLIS